MTSRLRSLYRRCLTPLVVLLAGWGVSPTGVTVAGTVATVAAALWFFPQGQVVWGTVVVLVCLLGDGVDGQLARFGHRETRLGAFLDSTLDRMADAAVFTGIAWWRLGRDDELGLGLALAVLVLGFLVSYARARAEAEGWDASAGLFERADRILVALAGVFAVGVGAPEWVLWLALSVVAAGSAVTVGQRIAAAARAAAAG